MYKDVIKSVRNGGRIRYVHVTEEDVTFRDTFHIAYMNNDTAIWLIYYTNVALF